MAAEDDEDPFLLLVYLAISLPGLVIFIWIVVYMCSEVKYCLRRSQRRRYANGDDHPTDYVDELLTMEEGRRMGRTDFRKARGNSRRKLVRKYLSLLVMKRDRDKDTLDMSELSLSSDANQSIQGSNKKRKVTIIPSCCKLVKDKQKKMKNSCKNIEFVSETKDEVCCICLSNFLEGDILARPKAVDGKPDKVCDHIFHYRCLEKWLVMNHDECPICRTRIIPKLWPLRVNVYSSDRITNLDAMRERDEIEHLFQLLSTYETQAEDPISFHGGTNQSPNRQISNRSPRTQRRSGRSRQTQIRVRGGVHRAGRRCRRTTDGRIRSSHRRR